MNRLLAIAMLLSSSVILVGQTTKPGFTQLPPKQAATTKPSSTKPASSQANVRPDGEILKPKDITYGTSSIPGDSEVLSHLGELNLLAQKYQIELEDFQRKLDAKYLPAWNDEHANIQKAIQKVKDANKWGDDVIFDGATKQWIKLTPEEVKKMKNAAQPKK